ncbi:MAG: S53 family peptidase [Jatrophihabitans sp.]|uniref:S53 family peptidase n=1 Tax=Jatrophihabitans sp. TaxID=1932789 RepID=UPI003F81E95D
MTKPRVVLSGSERGPVTGARLVGPVDRDEPIEVTIVLRRREALPEDATELLRPSDFEAHHGADPDDVEQVRSVVLDAGAEVVDVHMPSRRVRVRGSAGVLADLFGTELQVARDESSEPAVEHRQRQGALSLPSRLDGLVLAVLGLDDRRQARAWFRPAAASASSFTPTRLADLYAMPTGTDGSGTTIAIIELGGGYGDADLDTYFARVGVARPTVRPVGVDGASNVPGQDPNGADGEVLLDIEVAGAIAPGAELIVYFAPNTDAGFLDAIATATHATPTPTSMSISWGQSDDQWTAQARQAMDAAFADAVALGITVTAAAGDNGSADAAGSTSGGAHGDFPAASPHVLACGGTRLEASGSAITAETVWNDGTSGGATGGGVSDTFPLPTWQQQAGVPARADAGTTGRGVPDVAAVADPQTGYQVLVDGRDAVYGGTSAVAPLWAALVCRLVQALGRPLGLLQPALYTGAASGQSPTGFRDITEGSNGAYQAGPGWDACTGLGSPDGAALLEALRARG